MLLSIISSPIKTEYALRILFITPEAPWPPTSGGKQRSNLVHRGLSQVAEVHTLVLREPSTVTPADREELTRSFGLLDCIAPLTRGQRLPWRILRPLAPAFIDRLAHNLGRRYIDFEPDPVLVNWLKHGVDLKSYDLVVGRYLMSLSKTGVLGKRPTLLDIDDLPTSVYQGRLTSPTTKPWMKAFIRTHLTVLEQLLPTYWAKADALWVSKLNDQVGNAEVLHNVPWSDAGGDTSHRLRPAANSKTLLIVASFNHQPNIDGLNYFLDKIWPRILDGEPDATLDVVGNAMPEPLKHQCRKYKNVNPIGFVSDLEAAYSACAFSVAPIFFGGGTNIKLLESFSYGRTCVATPQAVRGFSDFFKHEQHLLIAGDAQSFSKSCIRLLGDGSFREELADEAYAQNCKEFSVERFCSTVSQRAATLVAESPY